MLRFNDKAAKALSQEDNGGVEYASGGFNAALSAHDHENWAARARECGVVDVVALLVRALVH